MLHVYNTFLNLSNISPLFYTRIIISSTFLEFSLLFTILSLFDLVAAYAILFPKSSPALWTTCWKQFWQHLVQYPIIVFYIFSQMIKSHILYHIFLFLKSLKCHQYFLNNHYFHKYICEALSYNLFSTYDNFYFHMYMFHYSAFVWNYMLYLHELQSHEICSFIALASFLFVIILSALTFMSFVSFWRYLFGDKTLELQVHVFKLIMNR